jgi:hypothetical protein
MNILKKNFDHNSIQKWVRVLEFGTLAFYKILYPSHQSVCLCVYPATLPSNGLVKSLLLQRIHMQQDKNCSTRSELSKESGRLDLPKTYYYYYMSLFLLGLQALANQVSEQSRPNNIRNPTGWRKTIRAKISSRS